MGWAGRIAISDLDRGKPPDRSGRVIRITAEPIVISRSAPVSLVDPGRTGKPETISGAWPIALTLAPYLARLDDIGGKPMNDADQRSPNVVLFDLLASIFPPGRAFDASSIAVEIPDHPDLLPVVAFFGGRTIKTGFCKGRLTAASRKYLTRWLAGLDGRTFNGDRLLTDRFGWYWFIAVEA